MALYRQIYITFWSDPKIDDDFTPEDKYFYLYLLTNTHTNVAGCYEISMKQCSRELGYNEDTIKVLLKRMEEIHRVIRYSSETKEVLILNWYKYNWSTSPNFIKGVKECINYIKNKEYKSYVISKLEDLENKNRRSETVEDPISTSVYSYSYSYSPVTDSVSDSTDKDGSVGKEKRLDLNKASENVIKHWNETRLPQIARVKSDSERGVMLRARLKEFGVEDVIKAVDLAAESDYLQDQHWFDFGWFVRPNNFVKVLEGKYNRDGTGENKRGRNGNSSGTIKGSSAKYSDLQYISPEDESTWGT